MSAFNESHDFDAIERDTFPFLESETARASSPLNPAPPVPPAHAVRHEDDDEAEATRAACYEDGSDTRWSRTPHRPATTLPGGCSALDEDVAFPWALREDGGGRPRTRAELREFWASLALRHTPHLGARTWKRLMDFYGDPMKAVLAARRWRVDGLVSKQAFAAFRAEAWRTPARREWDAVRDSGVAMVLWSDPHFSAWLKAIPDPPLRLYRAGNPRLLAGPAVGVVGSRQASRWSLERAHAIARKLSEAGVTVVSGMAKGVDRHAHLGAMEGIGASVAVLGAGLDRVYPPANADVFAALARGGLVISEFGPGVEPRPALFPVRNRIISGLSLGVLVVEARQRSGALITARQALEQGREVFVLVPPEGAPGFEGNHRLLEQGAQAVSDAEAILEHLVDAIARYDAHTPRPNRAAKTGAHGPCRIRSATERAGACEAAQPLPGLGGTPREASREPSAETPPALDDTVDDDGRAVLSALATRRDPMHLDEVTHVLEWDAGRVSRALLMLELAGKVCQWPGLRYSAC